MIFPDADESSSDKNAQMDPNFIIMEIVWQCACGR